MKKVAHGINKDYSGLPPAERQIYKIVLQCYFKTIPVALLTHGRQSMSHSLSVTLFATWTNFRTASYRIPGGLCPLD